MEKSKTEAWREEAERRAKLAAQIVRLDYARRWTRGTDADPAVAKVHDALDALADTVDEKTAEELASVMSGFCADLKLEIPSAG